MKKYILAFITSNLFNLIVTGIVSYIISVISFHLYRVDVDSTNSNFSIIYSDFLNIHKNIDIIINLTCLAVNFSAGYLAARITKKKYLLFGALSSAFSFILGSIAIIESRNFTLKNIVLVSLPVLIGTLGGYIYFRRKIKLFSKNI